MSPWEVLGLPEGTDDATAIRRAYASKVKQHNPDDDPAGFQTVREAYEFLREWARARTEPGTLEEEPADPTPLAERRTREAADPAPLAERRARDGEPLDPLPPEPPHTELSERRSREPAEPLPDIPELAAIRAAAALAEGRDKALHAALRALADRMQTELRLVPVWSRAVLETVFDPERPRLIVSYARYGDVVLDLFEAEGALAMRIFEIFRREARIDRLRRLATAVMDHKGEPRHDVGFVIAFLAASVAIVAPDIARSLADRAFHGATRKEEALPEWLGLDRLLAAGEEIRFAGADARAHLAARIDGTAGTSPVPPEALRITARLKPSSALLGLLLERDQEFVADAEARFPRRQRAAPAETQGWKAGLHVLWVVVAVIMLAGRSCKPDKPEPRRDYRIDPEMRKLIDDINSGEYFEKLKEGLPKEPVGTRPRR